jgi:uncharacterized protein (TIGR02001 family)
MKSSVSRLAVVVSLLCAGSVFAQTAEPAVSANLTFTTNYKTRGQDQVTTRTSMVKPALQGGFDYAHASGFYLGNWNSSVGFNASNSLESDLYGGYKFAMGDLSFDVGAITYLYPGLSTANTGEIYGGVGYGPFSAKYSYTVTKGYFGTGQSTADGRGTSYINLAYAQEVMPKVTLKASVGHTNYTSAVNNAGTPDYSDYSVGAAYDLGSGFTLGGAFVGASKKDNAAFNYTVGTTTKSINRSAFIVSITKAM